MDLLFYKINIVNTDEIKFGDKDKLVALTAAL